MIKTPLYDLNRSCTACPLSEGCQGPVPAVGPVGAEVMFVGEAPGRNEDEGGEPWVGDAGKYLDSLLSKVGLSREEVLFSNTVKCRPHNNATPTPEQARFCGERWLAKEIELYKPKIIMLLGKVATEFFLGEGETIEHRHGIPVQADASLYQSFLPAYHPAAGFYDTGIMRFIQEDFAVLEKLVKGEKVRRPVDDLEPSYQEIPLVTTEEESLHLTSPIALDTETIDDRLWSVQLSDTPGVGWFFQGAPELPFKHMAVHNYMYDSRFVELPEQTDDTMVMAYVLGLPQGLKELAWRLCGMEMKSYQETIAGHRKRKSLDYLLQATAAQIDWAPPPTIEDEKWNKKTNSFSVVVRKPKHISKKIAKILTDIEAGKVLKDGPVNPWKRWHDIDPRERAEVESVLGPMPDASLEDIPRSDAIYYSARDPDATLRVYNVLNAEIDRKGVRPAYEIDRQTLPIAREMEKNGIKVDMGHLEWLSRHYSSNMEVKSEEIFNELKIDCPSCEGSGWISLSDSRTTCESCHGTTYWRFNPNSDKELRVLFFGKLRFKPTKLTPKDRLPSVESNELAKIKHPIVKLVEEYRHLAHLKNSFADPLQKWADSEHKIHTTINPTRTGTGRWSMRRPNLQQIPARTELGQLVRGAFTSSAPNWSLFAADYSQIEMRVAAHLSQCRSMIQMFWDDRDIHTETAAELFGVRVEDVTKAQRYPAKTTGFGVIYGLTAHGLYTQMQAEGMLEYSEADCEVFIREYYKLRKELRDWQDQILSYARLNGFVRDIFGRIRYTPEMGCPLPRYRGDGERKAINMPVQSSAQGILKQAMVNLDRKHRAVLRSGTVKWLLQIHDELIWGLPDTHVDSWKNVVIPEMENAVKLSVPVKVETKVGKNWREME